MTVAGHDCERNKNLSYTPAESRMAVLNRTATDLTTTSKLCMRWKTHVYVCVYVHTALGGTNTYTYTIKYSPIYTYTHNYTHIRIYVHMHSTLHTHGKTYVYTYTYTLICTCTHYCTKKLAAVLSHQQDLHVGASARASFAAEAAACQPHVSPP